MQNFTSKAASFLDSHPKENLPTPKKSQAMDTLLMEIMHDQDLFCELETYLENEKGQDLDTLAFYVRVMDFKKE